VLWLSADGRIGAELVEAVKKIVLIAGRKSHGPVGNGIHDYGWSVKLLKTMLENSNIKGQVKVEIHLDGWPKDPTTLADADTIMVVSDGRDGKLFEEAPHLATAERVAFFDKQMKRGCGYVTFHFSTFAPEKHAPKVLDWCGGYFQWEQDGERKWYSAIRTLETEVQLANPKHPVARGLKALTIKEEFYYNLRFRAKDDKTVPIWTVPALMGREPDGNVVAWAREREDGGRGFGTSAGHFYDNWKHESFRTLILNALAWTAKLDVPEGGVKAKFHSHDEIRRHLGEASADADARSGIRKNSDVSRGSARTLSPSGGILANSATVAGAGERNDIRVLLFAGNDAHKWHNWQRTTPAIKELLEKNRRIKVEVSLDIEDLARKKLRDYQVIVQNYCNWHDPKGLSDDAKKAFVGFLKDGGGLVLVHFANGAFHFSLPKAQAADWPEYRRIVRRVWDHKGGSGHDAFGRFTVNIAPAKHPITAGLEDFEVSDELYFNQAGAEPIVPLLTARSKVTRRDEPLAWTYEYGKARVFQTLLGHSEKTYESPAACEMLRRAVAWTARAQGPATPTGAQADFDLVLAGGRVVDPESGLDAVRHVGIRGDKIAAVSEAPLKGKTIIDATGLVVAPGCIDLHAHGQELPSARMQAFDGVTTALELESGFLPVAKFYEHRAKEGRPINYGVSSGWAFARVAVLQGLEPDGSPRFMLKAFALPQWTRQPANQEQTKQILERVEQGLKEGALGIGMLAGYAPGFGQKENYEIHKLAARYGVPTFIHVRYMGLIEPNSSFAAYQEVVAMAASTGAHVHICHFNSTSLRDIEVCARLIADAQKRGLKITTEAYPYGTGWTGINAAFFKRPDWREHMGMDYGDITYLKTGERLTKERMEELQKSDPGGSILLRFLDPDAKRADQALLDRSVLFPGGAVASDGGDWEVDGKTVTGDVWPLPENAVAHPRAAGTFCRILGPWVRERKVLTLNEAIRRCALIPARILEKSVPQMRNKGRIKVGADADIIVFDAERVTDRATFAKPLQTSIGMRHVIVNGTFVIRDGELVREARPGSAVRHTRGSNKHNPHGRQ
jgi:N-acyl-D-glutamate deacylase